VLPPQRKRLLILITFSLLLVQFAAVVFEIESWPLTSAPMYAFYLGPRTPLYAFRFVGELADGSEAVLGALDLNSGGRNYYTPKSRQDREVGSIPAKYLSQVFFSRYYGSMVAGSPFGHHYGDD